MQIITNWRPRDLMCWHDLPVKAQTDFDYIDEDDRWMPRFVCYRGEWHDAHDTQIIEPDPKYVHPMGWAISVHPGSPLALFDSIESDSYFSGMLYHFIDDDQVIVARYLE